jgi:hypothetical protein
MERPDRCLSKSSRLSRHCSSLSPWVCGWFLSAVDMFLILTAAPAGKCLYFADQDSALQINTLDAG